jgi:hypothetical protein
MRKAFNFYKSYADVYFQLDVKERVKFMDALLVKQFYNIDVTIEGMANFALLSQKHSIQSQIDGYISKDGEFEQFEGAWQGAWQGGIKGASVQVEDKGKDKVKVKEKDEQEKGNVVPDLSEFLAYAIEKKPNVSKDHLRLKYMAWVEAGWKSGKGKDQKPILNWKTTLLHTLPYIQEIKSNSDPLARYR